VVGRDRARRRAAVDRRHGSCTTEIITPAGCATLARTVPRRSARARRARGSFPNTGQPTAACLCSRLAEPAGRVGLTASRERVSVGREGRRGLTPPTGVLRPPSEGQE
jgi:hypothetical protein